MSSPIAVLLKQRELLHIEYEFEKETFRRETEVLGVGRRVKRGDCWYPLRVGKSYYNSLNQVVIEVFRTEDREIEHNFEYGRPICFFSCNFSGQIRYLSFSSVVSYAEDDRLVAVLPGMDSATELQATDYLGVQLYFDETSYRLQFESLDKVIAAKNNRLSELRDIFHGTAPLGKNTPAPVRFPWLNCTQESAVNEILRAKDVAVVHGPPGTGKTTTLVEAVYEVLRRENQVLVCAQSNMAVDWISEKLIDRGVNVLRIGNPTRVNDKMLSFTFERRFESHPDYADLWAVRRSIRQLYDSRSSGRNEAFHQKIARLKDRATELELRIREQLLGEARVIACTLTGAANQLLTGFHFHTLFIDEAAQALEAASWIAIRKAHRVVLAGDHQQLPPTIKCYEAMRAGLGRTLMEAVVENKPQSVSLLTMQYRMNDTLIRFSSRWFYGGKVGSAPEVEHRGILDYDTPMAWIDTSGLDCTEEFVGETYGRINKAEAELTVNELKEYVTRIGRQRMLDERLDIGVISPYKAQVQYLRRLFRRDAFFKPFRELLSVNTVDGFQGQERDIILISLVRANEQGQIGFLTDLRRMNVAMTRARMKLIILGNISTLLHHPFYKKLYEYVQSLSL